jgi:hypothetical protein
MNLVDAMGVALLLALIKGGGGMFGGSDFYENRGM